MPRHDDYASSRELGAQLVGQGRQLAGVSRRHPALTLMTNQERLATAGEAAQRMMEGTMLQNVGRRNPYSDVGRYIRTGRLPPQKTEAQAQVAAQIQPQGGLAQMLAAQGASEDIVEATEQVESIPGGKELLYTVAAEELMKGAGVPKKDAKKVRLYRIGGQVEQAYAKGGPARAAAERARRAGRGEDEMLVHMTEDEFDVIRGMWGDPDINPNTGLPEYGFLSKLWKGVKKVVKKVVKSKIFQVVAPIALSVFAPGLGTAIGGALGLGSGTAASIAGNALLRGGISAAGGRGFTTGAISGAIAGGLGRVAGEQVSKLAPGLSERTANIIGAGLASGAGAELTGGDFMTGAVAGGMGEFMRPTSEALIRRGQEAFGVQPVEGKILAQKTPLKAAAEETVLGEPDFLTLEEPAVVSPEIQAQLEAGPITAPEPNIFQRGVDWVRENPALAAAGALGVASMAAEPGYAEGPPPELPPEFTESLPVYTMQRQFQGLPDPSDYYTYGIAGAPQSGQHLFITPPDPFAGETGTPTAPPQAQAASGWVQDPVSGAWIPSSQSQFGRGFQRGGEFDYWEQNADVPRVAPSVAQRGHYVKGAGTGRSDDIPARLSDGEYVIDAESVALLGDGSGDAGARRLDEMRRNLRKHKAQKLKKGEFTHKAKTPEQYMARGGMARLRRAAIETGRT